MKFVVDASFIASWLLPDEASTESDALAARLSREGATAPGLLQLEVINVLLIAARRKRISEPKVKELLDAFAVLAVDMQPALTTEQRSDVLRLAQTHSLTAYDAAYLELALRLGLVLVSLDHALTKAATEEGLSIVSA